MKNNKNVFCSFTDRRRWRGNQWRLPRYCSRHHPRRFIWWREKVEPFKVCPVRDFLSFHYCSIFNSTLEMTASFLLKSLQTQSFLLAGPYTVCIPLHHFLPLYPSLSFSLWLPTFLPFQLLLHTLNSTFSLCYHSWTFLPLPLSFCSLCFTFFFSLLHHLDLLFFSP